MSGIGLVLRVLLFLSPGIGMAESQTEVQKYRQLYLRPNAIPYPEDNGYSSAREKLGHLLFFDPRLSASDWISCASCHNPGFSWGDGLPKAKGHEMKTLPRRTPTLLDSAWMASFFWDGRAATLEEQALLPIQAMGEMALSLSEMVGKLTRIKGYNVLFEKAYPGEGITEKTVAKAIATYERVASASTEAPFDHWIKGDTQAISSAARRGFILFNSKAACSQCHSGWRFTDDSFHDIGVRGDDKGRGALFPDIEVNQFAFKTPTLRNVAWRSPYMHDGSEATLADVIDLYNIGGREKRASLSTLVRPLNLTEQERKDLREFLGTLSSPVRKTEIPMLPR
ncbi:MAG TPA: cytochrome c peroxidase [Oligoflexus sp.]|uniref:cytochrome-c peroxidase n=1 Tax=Oligoflexus sp. TaxID=1971216 RepID=UPI002D639D2F|nr:cytochrome c peroxidase [Oligoflexus sp.]HYX36887.1 cytochrome c peroxidase [Oligoflexus sp.]